MRTRTAISAVSGARAQTGAEKSGQWFCIYIFYYLFYIYYLFYSPYLLSMSRAAASAPLNCILRPVPSDTTDTDNEDCASGLTFHISPQICTRTVMTTTSTGVFVPGVKWSMCFKYLPTLCRFRHILKSEIPLTEEAATQAPKLCMFVVTWLGYPVEDPCLCLRMLQCRNL